MKTLDELNQEDIKNILENTDWTEIQDDKVIVKDTWGETILEIKDYEIEYVLDVFLKQILPLR